MDELGAMFAKAQAPPLLVRTVMTDEQVDALRRTQDDLIDEVQDVMGRWCARRHQTVQAAFQFYTMPLQNMGPADLAEAWTAWCRGAFQRLSEDASDQVEFAAVVAKCCSNGVLMSAAGQAAKTKAKEAH